MRGPKISEAGSDYLHGKLGRGEIVMDSAKRIDSALRELVHAVGDIPVKRLDRKHAEAWMAHTSRLKASTRRLRWGFVSLFCDWCVDEELLARNPFRRLKPPKPPRRPPRARPAEDVARLLATVPDLRARLIVLLMVQQGLRCVEVSNLEVADIDWDARTMRVQGKGSHERVLPITDECWDTLTAYLRQHPATSGPLVRAWMSNGGSMRVTEQRASSRAIVPSGVSKLMTRWMLDAGIKHASGDGISAHALRHTCATDMLEAGADLLEVRDTLGHTSIATTQIYLGSASGRLKTAMGGRRYGRIAS